MKKNIIFAVVLLAKVAVTLFAVFAGIILAAYIVSMFSDKM